MIKRIISGSIALQILLVAFNTLASIIVTRDLSIIEKSSQAYINLVCGIGVIIFNQSSIEIRLAGAQKVKYAGVNLQTIIYLLIGMFALDQLRTDYTTWILTAFMFSLALLNSSRINEYYIEHGNLATQKIRLVYSSILLTIIFVAHILLTISVGIWILCFIISDICLFFFLKVIKGIRVETMSQNISSLINLSYIFQTRKLAAITANIIEIFFVIFLGILSSPELIAYLSVSLSIISVFTVPFVALQAPILSNSDVLFAKLKRRSVLYLGILILITVIMLQFTLKNFYARLTLFIYGPSYYLLAKNAYLIAIAGLCSLLSRTLNSIFRGMGRFRLSLLATLSPIIVIIPLLILNLNPIYEAYVVVLSLTALPLVILLFSLKFRMVR